ncbi:MAG TPA: hypothetical protein VI306_13075 [Pyrinomonadaceae bacterium]
MRSGQIVTLFLLLLVTGCRSTQQPGAVATTSPAPTSLTTPATPAGPVSQPAPGEAAVEVKPRVDACALLTSQEVKAVQGEEPKETKLAGRLTSGFAISQCFFSLPTFSNSISLMVAQRADGPGAKDPEEFWRERFHLERDGDREDKDKDRERADRDKKKGERGEEEEEEEAPPKKISGVGKEAYWVGNRVGGALYVLKGNAYLRISIGGPPEQASKISKSKTLAQKALARLRV